MPGKAKLTTVYDNYLQRPGLKTGHGFACLLELENGTMMEKHFKKEKTVAEKSMERIKNLVGD